MKDMHEEAKKIKERNAAYDKLRRENEKKKDAIKYGIKKEVKGNGNMGRN